MEPSFKKRFITQDPAKIQQLPEAVVAAYNVDTKEAYRALTAYTRGG